MTGASEVAPIVGPRNPASATDEGRATDEMDIAAAIPGRTTNVNSVPLAADRPVAAVKPVCIEVASNQVGQVRMKLVLLYQRDDRQPLVSDVFLSSYSMPPRAIALFEGCRGTQEPCHRKPVRNK